MKKLNSYCALPRRFLPLPHSIWARFAKLQSFPTIRNQSINSINRASKSPLRLGQFHVDPKSYRISTSQEAYKISKELKGSSFPFPLSNCSKTQNARISTIHSRSRFPGLGFSYLFQTAILSSMLESQTCEALPSINRWQRLGPSRSNQLSNYGFFWKLL